MNFGIGSTSSDTASLTYQVTGNRFRGASGVAFGVQKGVGTVTNNLIGDAYTVCLDVGQGAGNANVLTGIRDATDGSSITSEEYSVIANNIGVTPSDLWWKLLGYPIATYTPTDATTIDNVLGSANGGVSGWIDAAQSSSTYAGNGGAGATCDLP